MSYGASAAFQAAIYQQLTGDPTITSLLGDAIFDAVPAGAVPPLYISLGAEDVSASGTKTDTAARHRFNVSVISESAGFLEAKTVAGAVSDALHDATPALSRGRVVRLQFLKAAARRVGTGNKRRIDLRFEALVEDD